MSHIKTSKDVQINRDTVKYIASLVKLGLSDLEAETFRHQFETILDYFSRLDEVNVEEVPPASQSPVTKEILRADKVEISIPLSAFLVNVPRTERNFVKVAAIFDNDATA